MLTPIIAVVDIVLWCIQGLLMLVFVVPLQRTAQALTWASWRILRWFYYPVVVVRRRITGRPRWKLSDLTIGITAPEGAVDVDVEDVK